MKIVIPELNATLRKIINVESEFDGRKQKIGKWVSECRNDIKEHRKLLSKKTDKNDIVILNLFLRSLLTRSTTGEAGIRIYEKLTSIIKYKSDLNGKNYKEICEGYRWGIPVGSKVIADVVEYMGSEWKWDWQSYIKTAEKERKNNYQTDRMLKIKHIKFKLRDLALSDFSSYYAAFDVHVPRVITRIGWLSYGFPLLGDANLEMGNNPQNDKNYLFLHSLFNKLSEISDYKPVDLDRIFWHFGRTICGDVTICNVCPIKDECLTGKYRS